jgi:hypothetical protein
VGKVQLALAPPLNHWWHVTFRVTSHGLTTGTLCGSRHLTMTFDFVEHKFVVQTFERGTQAFDLEPMTVADFYQRVRAILDRLGIDAHIWPVPVEMKDTTPFPEDRYHGAYDRDAVERFHRALLSVEQVFDIHRGRFLGKSSPVHFFWGAFDLAVTRFSGRRNPSPPNVPIMREAYSHEVISHGFWPGGDFLDKTRVEEPVFYAYALPEPAGFQSARIQPADARYDETLGEYLLPYETVRRASNPEAMLLSFMETTYLAAARAAGWNVDELAAATAQTR